MPRVAMIIQRYLPHIGGAEKQLQQLAPRLRERGYEVCILTRHEKGLLHEEVIDGVLVHRLPSIGPKPLAAAAWVRWTNDPLAPKAAGLPPGMGIEFLDLDAAARAALDAFVSERCRESECPTTR